VHLTRLVIHKYRNVAPGTTLVFNPGKNVLLGKNATGKSTLLNLIATVACSDFSALKSEEFSLEYEMVTSECHLQVSVQNEREGSLVLLGGRIPLDAMVPLHGKSYQFTWSLRLTFTAPLPVIQVDTTPSTTCVTIEKAPGDTRSESIQDRSLLSDNILTSGIVSAVRLLQEDVSLYRSVIKWWRSEFSSGYSRFDESLDFFKRMLEENVSLGRVGSRGDFFALAPVMSARVLAVIEKALTDDPERVVLDFSNKQLPFLDAAVAQMEFDAGHMRAERIEKRLGQNFEELRFGGFRFDFTRKDGSAINQSLLSFGQKRLLSFYYYLDCCPKIAIADELVNGLHHYWIETCLDAIGDRQAFLTSQNPLLLDYLSFESAEHARSSFILCRTEKHDGHERMVWSNMAEEDAERFFTAYQAGIQHVSEILRTKGLW
jgi:energy-coupling factor transporter ATP-binding protein EcfA2